MCRGVAKETLNRKMKIEFGIACYLGHYAGHFKKKGLYSPIFDRVIASSTIRNKPSVVRTIW